ncbi:unnamed protein product [Protopolystoma xenopodis]|uniref:Uncharacterized protein n=1 Tax=Protopolystoma xenopodis TaxID=117903 RepID=A0A3S5CM55_9PLAT|nr:unnamed protein product [Protopolystoma xenopodis]
MPRPESPSSTFHLSPSTFHLPSTILHPPSSIFHLPSSILHLYLFSGPTPTHLAVAVTTTSCVR